MVDEAVLQIIIAAKDEASAALAKVGAELEGLSAGAKASAAEQMSLGAALSNLGTSSEKLGRSLTTWVALPIAAVGVASAKMAMDFQQAMTYIRTDAGDMTDNINQLSEAVLRLAHNSQFSPDQLAAGLYHLASLGLRGADALNALNTAQQMAAVGGADLESTTSALGSALVTGIKGVQNYSNAAGVLDATIGAGNMRMQDLIDALGTGVLPVFKVAGLSIVDFGAALATMTDNGMDAARAATRLRMTISLMEAPSQGAVTALKAIGMTSNQLGMDMQTKGLIPALQDLKKHLEDTYGATDAGKQKIAAALTEIFGGGRSSAGIELLIQQLGRVQNKYNQIEQQSGEFASKVAEQQQTAAAKIKTAWSSIQASLIQLGATILPPLTEAFAKLAAGVVSVANWYNNLDPPTKVLINTFAILLGIFGPLLLVFGKLVKIVNEARAAFMALRTVLITAGVAEDAVNPIFAIITAIALLAIGIYEIVTHWQAVEAWIKAFWERWRNYIVAFTAMFMPAIFAIALAADLITTFWGPISHFFEVLFGDIKETVTGFINWFKTLWHDPLQAIQDFANGIIAVFEKLLSDIKQWASDFVDTLKNGFNEAKDKFIDIGKSLVQKIKDGWDDATRDVKGWTSELSNGLRQGFDNAKQNAKTWGGELASALKSGWDTVSRDATQWGKDVVGAIGKAIAPNGQSGSGNDLTNKIFSSLGLNNVSGGILGGLVSGAKSLTAFDISSLIDWKRQAVSLYQKTFALGKTLVSNIEAGFKQGWSDAKQWVSDAYNAIKGAWDKAWKNVKQWGGDIVKGIKNGWDSSWADTKQWVVNAYNGIKQAWDRAWKNVRQWGKDIISGAGGIVSGMTDGIGDIVNFFKNLPKNIYNFIFKSGSGIADAHQDGVSSQWTSTSKMRQIGDAILKGIGIAVAAVLGAIILLLVSVGIAMINGIVRGIANALGALGSALGWIYQHVINAVRGAGSWLYQTGRDIVMGLIHGVESAVGGVGSALGHVGSDIASSVKGALHWAHIPGFATGVQNFIGGAAMVGENGPELVTLPAGANVYTAGQTQSMLNSNNSSTVTIGTVVLSSPGAVQEFFKKIDQDSILTGMGLTPNRGLR